MSFLLAARADNTQPELGYLILLVFEAVMEVVCVSLPGYILARQGSFNREMQKFAANLNLFLFTPALIFSKLASQLTMKTIAELAIIPAIFIVTTLASYVCAVIIGRVLGFEKRARNFIIAMGVFGNSNSLPMSLVLSLSMTVKGLHWSKLPNDKDEDVAARGILYLLIFQQLGQLLRWSWGYNVLLAPAPKPAEGDDQTAANSTEPSDLEAQNGRDRHASFRTSHQPRPSEDSVDSVDSVDADPVKMGARPQSAVSVRSVATSDSDSERRSSIASSVTDWPAVTSPNKARFSTTVSVRPTGFEKVKSRLSPVTNVICRCYNTFMGIMNPPLWAMLAALIVASFPQLQSLFFTPGSFVQNSVTRAINQCGGVAVPLILVVLGANLAGQTAEKKDGVEPTPRSPAEVKFDRKLLIASLTARMVFPFLITAPLLAVVAKFLPISILGDPIFVIVCFLLAGSPSALQLAQICQMNNVYEYVMAKILFWSYVVVVLPSTLVLVVSAMQVLQWTK